jgi:hypothetical protein
MAFDSSVCRVNMRCEASTSWEADAYGQPRIIMCGEPAKLYSGFMRWEIKLCDTHHEFFQAKRDKMLKEKDETDR